MTNLADKDLADHYYNVGTVGMTKAQIERAMAYIAKTQVGQTLFPGGKGKSANLIQQVAIVDIQIGADRRPLDEKTVLSLMESIRRTGLMNPPAVHFVNDYPVDGELVDNVAVLIYGRHRLEAWRRLGNYTIDCLCLKNIDGIDAELLEIAENLHRAELTALQRDEQLARWIELTNSKREIEKEQDLVSSQVDTKPGRPESGINAAARELGIQKMDAHRAVKVAGLSPEAKEAAREAGLDDNRTALLAAAKALTPAEQVAAVQAWDTKRELASIKSKMAKTQKKAASSEAVEMAIMDFYTAWADIPGCRRREVLLEIDAAAFLETSS